MNPFAGKSTTPVFVTRIVYLTDCPGVRVPSGETDLLTPTVGKAQTVVPISRALPLGAKSGFCPHATAGVEQKASDRSDENKK